MIVGLATTYSYTVNKAECGLNIGIRLLKKFTLIPWANYESIDTKEASNQIDQNQNQYDQIRTQLYNDDIEMFWHSQARLKYGLDFSIRLFDRLELHVGGLLGSLVSTNKNDQIKDKTISASLAFDQKGN